MGGGKGKAGRGQKGGLKAVQARQQMTAAVERALSIADALAEEERSATAAASCEVLAETMQAHAAADASAAALAEASVPSVVQEAMVEAAASLRQSPLTTVDDVNAIGQRDLQVDDLISDNLLEQREALASWKKQKRAEAASVWEQRAREIDIAIDAEKEASRVADEITIRHIVQVNRQNRALQALTG